MQMKALCCILGLILIVILLIGRLIIMLPDREEPEVHIPVITEHRNVWIMEVGNDGLTVFEDGEKKEFPYGMVTTLPEDGAADGDHQTVPYIVSREAREQVADITLTDGCVTRVKVKSQKVNGRVLSADSAAVEIQGVGRLEIAPEARGYRLYDSLSMCSASDLLIGYDFNDFVLEDGKICAILMVKEDAMEYIRVLVKSSDYNGRFHESVSLSCDTDYTVSYGPYDNLAQELHTAGELCSFDRDSTYFQSDRITITPSVLTGRITLSGVSRSQGEPSYRGTIELLRTEEGLIVVNEVLLEEYLYCVVPSEMPSSYPAEALKAQAICARTYAYSHMLKAGYPQYGAHVDDSSSYQVYNNILEQESTTSAVKDTYGQLLYTPDGGLAGAYYYSTSCGQGSDATVWKSGAGENLTYLKARAINRTAMGQVLARAAAADGNGEGTGTDETQAWEDLDLAGQAMTDEKTFAAFIKGKSADDFEVAEGWYRWTYTVTEIDTEHMLNVLKKRYEANEKLVLTLTDGEYTSKPVTSLGKITDLYVAKRGSGGVAEELVIVTNKQTIKVITEHNIRYVLNDGKAKVQRQDGSQIESANLLPSAFLVIDASKERENVVGYTLTGGGFGHGVGMSQNGARAMATDGYQAGEILQFFYENCNINSIYSAEGE